MDNRRGFLLVVGRTNVGYQGTMKTAIANPLQLWYVGDVSPKGADLGQYNKTWCLVWGRHPEAVMTAAYDLMQCGADDSWHEAMFCQALGGVEELISADYLEDNYSRAVKISIAAEVIQCLDETLASGG